jgi:hypothetical protein
MTHLKETGICDEAEKHGSHDLSKKIIPAMVNRYEIPEIESVSGLPEQPMGAKTETIPSTAVEGNNLLQGQAIESQQHPFDDELQLFFCRFPFQYTLNKHKHSGDAAFPFEYRFRITHDM